MYLFEQTLSGLIKALRANKRDEQRVIDAALAEIRQEVVSKDWDVKAAAVLKLTYLEMLGHPTLIQHSFPVIECMSSSRYHIKQVGYLAASQSFGSSTEVILLAHNLIKKDLQASSHPSTVILALTSLPTLLTASPELADDLLQDLLRMLTHSKAQVRRIAILVLGKIWASHQSIELQFNHVEKLRGGLSDEDPSVVSATVNVMLELARARKALLQSLLGLAPELFDLLTNSSNNWMLIKIVKLFAILTPVEPRLVRKLLPPLSNLISTTPAFSLLYECIQTVIVGGMLQDSAALAGECISKLASFLSDADQNLSYIALKGLSRLLDNSPQYNGLLTAHYDEILTCIDEEDLTIRLKALELIEKLSDRSNTKEIVRRLLEQIAPSSLTDSLRGRKGGSKGADRAQSAAASLRAISSNYDRSSPSGLADTASTTPTVTSNAAFSNYRYRILLLILRMTSRSSDDGSQLYVNITNFEWYIGTLITVAYMSLSIPSPAAMLSSVAKGKGRTEMSLSARVAEALLDVTSRATSIQDFAVKRCTALLADDGFLERDSLASYSEAGDGHAILIAAAFVISEYGTSEGRNALRAAELIFSKVQHICATSQGAATAPVQLETIQVTTLVLCGMKCIARWLDSFVSGQASTEWKEESLVGIVKEVDRLAGILQELPGGAGERFRQLLQVVKQGLHEGPRLPAAPSAEPDSASSAPGGANESEDAYTGEDDPLHNPFAGSSSTQPPHKEGTPGGIAKEKAPDQGAPAMLSFLHALFFTYELRPLAPQAQEAVSPSEALDLDTWIGPERLDSGAILAELDQDTAKMSREAKVDEYGRPLQVSPSEGVTIGKSGKSADGKSKKGKKASRTGERAAYEENDDVESIPIIRLDLQEQTEEMPSSAEGKSSKKSKKNSKEAKETAPRRPRTPSPPPIILTAGGEMPSSRPSKPSTPVPPAQPASRAEDTEVGNTSIDVALQPSTQAVKVVRVKKKGKDPAGEKKTKKSKSAGRSTESTGEGNLVSL